MHASNVVMNEKYKGDYNIHSEVHMNTLCIFPMYVLHMYMDMEWKYMNMDEFGWMKFIHGCPTPSICSYMACNLGR
jgi:hypothetical protein